MTAGRDGRVHFGVIERLLIFFLAPIAFAAMLTCCGWLANKVISQGERIAALEAGGHGAVSSDNFEHVQRR